MRGAPNPARNIIQLFKRQSQLAIIANFDGASENKTDDLRAPSVYFTGSGNGTSNRNPEIRSHLKGHALGPSCDTFKASLIRTSVLRHIDICQYVQQRWLSALSAGGDARLYLRRTHSQNRTPPDSVPSGRLYRLRRRRAAAARRRVPNGITPRTPTPSNTQTMNPHGLVFCGSRASAGRLRKRTAAVRSVHGPAARLALAKTQSQNSGGDSSRGTNARRFKNGLNNAPG